MFNLFDYFILTPLRLAFQGVYEVILLFVSNYGLGIIGLSCITALVLIPIEKAVRGSIIKEKKIESILHPQLADIKNKFSGIEKNNAIKRLYSRYGYSPLYAIRNVYGVLVQLPFLFGAYLMLSSYYPLNGQSFVFIKDLSLQDQLLGQINLLPILMTVINISTLLFLNLSKKENIQATIIAIAFLALLYTAPSALLLYWTMNNVIHLLRAVLKKYVLFNELKKNLYERTRIFFNKYKKTVIVKYLEKQLIDKPTSEFFKKNWFIYLFMCSNIGIFIAGFTNLGFFSPDDISRSLVFTFLLFIILFPVLNLLKKIGNNIKFFKQFFIFFILFIGAYLYYKTAGYIVFESLPRLARITCIMTLFIIFYLIGGIKIVNLVLIINTLGAVILGVYNNYDSQQKFLSSIDNNKTQYVQLNEKPNLYYLLCESMNSLDIAIKEYGLDETTAKDFVEYLNNNGFYVPDYVYSNAYHTLMTLQTVYLMKDFVGGNKGNADGSTSVRPMIAGSNYNVLLKILKNNNYYTSAYLPYHYFSAQKGPLLDFYDAAVLSNSSLLAAEASSFVKKILSILKNIVFMDKNIDTNSYTIIYKYFLDEPHSPHFMLHRIAFTQHTMGDEAFSAEGRASYRTKYKKMYIEEINALKYITSHIIKNDPNAIIVLCGDHGAHLYRTKAGSVDELKKDLEKSSISYEDFINDKFKVFAAVRIPHNYKQIQDKFSPGNVFSYIFNIIGYSGNKLTICDNNAYFDGTYIKGEVPVIKDGNIVPLDELSKK